MAHKTLVGGTAYDITGGKCLVDGTGYSIKKGRTLVGGTGYDVNFAPPSLEDMTWAEIKAISTAGEAENYWAVGDTKSITLNGTVGNGATYTDLVIDAYIVGFNHNSAREGGNRIHFKIGKINGVDVALVDGKYGSTFTAKYFFLWNYDSTNGTKNIGGWESSSIRKVILGSQQKSPVLKSLMSCLPSDLRSAMKSVTKYTDNVGNGTTVSSNVTATTDYLWLPSEFEIRGVRTYANTAEKNYQAQYDYYKAGNSKVHYKHDNISTACAIWTRSVVSGNAERSVTISVKGAANREYCNKVRSISPIFAV